MFAIAVLVCFTVILVVSLYKDWELCTMIFGIALLSYACDPGVHKQFNSVQTEEIQK